MTYLEDALRELAQARQQLEFARGHVVQLDDILSPNTTYQKLLAAKTRVGELSAAIGAADAKVRDLALAEHALSGNAKPAEGVQVKLFSKVVYQQDEAEKWCFQHACKYLLLDSKAFEKAAPVLKDLGAPVEVAKEARVQIATELSAWLLSDQQRWPVIE